MNLFDVRNRPSAEGVSLVSTWMRQGVIRSVQSGSIDLNNVTSNTAPVNVVNLDNAILLMRGWTHASAVHNANICYPMLAMTNSTTVTASRFDTEAVAMPVGFFLFEFLPGILRSVQSRTIELNGGTSNTATILPVNPTKAFIIDLGFKINVAAEQLANQRDRALSLTNATTVTATIATNPAASHISSFMVVDPF